MANKQIDYSWSLSVIPPQHISIVLDCTEKLKTYRQTIKLYKPATVAAQRENPSMPKKQSDAATAQSDMATQTQTESETTL